MRLCSRAYLDTEQSEQPHVKLAWLDGEAGGSIALSGGPNGPLDRAIGAGQSALVQSRCAELQRLFGDRLYVELQRHGMAARIQPERGTVICTSPWLRPATRLRSRGRTPTRALSARPGEGRLPGRAGTVVGRPARPLGALGALPLDLDHEAGRGRSRSTT